MSRSASKTLGLAAVILATALGLPAFAKRDGPCHIETRALAAGRTEIRVRNDAPGPLTVALVFDLENYEVRGQAKDLVVPGGASVVAAVLEPIDRLAKRRYRYIYYYQYGDMHATPADVAYRIPYAPGTTHKLGQGYFGKFSHQKQHALDFRMPERTPIVAARAGTVVATEDHYSQGGIAERFKARSNFISILHADGTVATYRHLCQDGVQVAVGERVAAGDVIGLSGNTGYSSRPHLHFDVRVPDGGRSTHTVATRFRTRQAPKGTLLSAETAYEAY